MVKPLQLLAFCVLVGCGGSGGSGGGTTPPPDTELQSAPVGAYFGVIDWTGNDQSCRLDILANDQGQPSGEVVLTLTGGSSGVSGTLAAKKLSLIGDKPVSIRQTLQGVQIVAVDFNNTLINVVGPS
jgi:hypothetical protein